MLLAGTFSRVLDDKLRLPIPKPLRDAMGGGAAAVVYITPGTDGSLAIFPEVSFARMADQLSAGSPTGQDVRTFSRLFFAQAQRVELDGQGRVRIPAEFAKFSSINKEVVLLGVRDHMELWDKLSWEKFLAQHQPHYDQLAERAFASPSVGESSRDAQGGSCESARPTQPR